MSSGLRYLFDHNSAHIEVLQFYGGRAQLLIMIIVHLRSRLASLYGHRDSHGCLSRLHVSLCVFSQLLPALTHLQPSVRMRSALHIQSAI